MDQLTTLCLHKIVNYLYPRSFLNLKYTCKFLYNETQNINYQNFILSEKNQNNKNNNEECQYNCDCIRLNNNLIANNCIKITHIDIHETELKFRNENYYESIFNKIFDKCDSIQYLNISGCSNIKPEILSKFDFNNLKYLNISGCFNFNDKILEKILSQTNNLQYLNISSTYISDIISYNKLKHLNISSTRFIKDNVFLKIAQECNQLEILESNNLTSFDDNHVIKIIANCKKLKELDVRDCIFVTELIIDHINHHNNIYLYT